MSCRSDVISPFIFLPCCFNSYHVLIYQINTYYTTPYNNPIRCFFINISEKQISKSISRLNLHLTTVAVVTTEQQTMVWYGVNDKKVLLNDLT